MSATEAPIDEEHEGHPAHAGHQAHSAVPGEPGAHEHPSDNRYIVIGLILAVLTAIEVGLYYIKGGALSTVALLIFMVVKFTIVVGFFMHLRFDSPVFRRLFAIGLSMAIFIYTVTLFTFGVFHV